MTASGISESAPVQLNELRVGIDECQGGPALG
jgi:hypothetical protein